MEVGEQNIQDLSGYLYKMQKSMIDKMFFIDKIFEPIDYIMDFGCANGELIKMLLYYFDEYKYIGYDISDSMIREARRNVPGAVFYTKWDDISEPFDKSLLNISSVIHEIYSYSNESDILLFWKRVFESGFKYVTIRDMMISENTQRPADEKDMQLIRKNEMYKDHLKDYEDIWGEIRTDRDMIHYLLKYSYSQNWKREVREDYLGLTLEKFISLVPADYRITYREHYTLPYVSWQIKKDFGIDLQSPTHIKVILEKI